MATQPEPQVHWWEPFVWLAVICGIFGLLIWLNGCQTVSGERSTVSRSNADPPLPALPVVALEVTSRVTVGTNVVICGTNRITHQPYCVTNPVVNVPPIMMTLAWNVPGYLAVVKTTNHLLWSTNVNGPWTGDIPVTCTNSNMVANVIFNPRVKQMFFRLGTNTF